MHLSPSVDSASKLTTDPYRKSESGAADAAMGPLGSRQALLGQLAAGLLMPRGARLGYCEHAAFFRHRARRFAADRRFSAADFDGHIALFFTGLVACCLVSGSAQC